MQVIERQTAELAFRLHGTERNGNVTVFMAPTVQYTIEIPNDNCDSDDGGGEEPLIQEPDLDILVSQVPPELLEQTPEHHLTPPESALSTDPDTTPAPPAEPDTTLQEETPHTVLT